MKFTEERLEEAIIELLTEEKIPHVLGAEIMREPSDVLIKEDLQTYLPERYEDDEITIQEVDNIIRQLERTV